MIRAAFFALVLIALPAAAADFCTLPDAKPLPDQLAGQWQGLMRGGILVGADGKPQALPADEVPQSLVFKADGQNLTLVGDGFFPAVALAPAPGTKDFALPGESPLEPAELLQQEVGRLGLTCDPANLPRFFAQIPMDAGAVSRFDIFAVAQDDMVLVVQGAGQGQAARAVFDLHRAPKP